MKKLKTIAFIFFGIVISISLIVFTFIGIKSPIFIKFEGDAEKYSEIIKNKDLNVLQSHLPYFARKITYRIYPYRQVIEASFEVSEDEFLKWVRLRNWEVEMISTPENVNGIFMKGKKLQEISIEIKKGYFFMKEIPKEDNPEMFKSMLTIFYDSDTQMCYYSYVTS